MRDSAVYVGFNGEASDGQAAQLLSPLLLMTSTYFLVAGVSQKVLEGFACLIAENQDCQWSVRPDGRRFELCFDCEISFLKAATVQRVLRIMGATDCLCIAGQTLPRVVLPSL